MHEAASLLRHYGRCRTLVPNLADFTRYISRHPIFSGARHISIAGPVVAVAGKIGALDQV